MRALQLVASLPRSGDRKLSAPGPFHLCHGPLCLLGPWVLRSLFSQPTLPLDVTMRYCLFCAMAPKSNAAETPSAIGNQRLARCNASPISGIAVSCLEAPPAKLTWDTSTTDHLQIARSQEQTTTVRKKSQL